MTTAADSPSSRRGHRIPTPAARDSDWNGDCAAARRTVHDDGLLNLYPAGGDALSLVPSRLVVALIVNFVLGALVTLGIGSYGPSLVLFSLLGMEPRAAFPIMMGSGAFMGMVAAMRFVSSGRYAARAALGLTLGGIPGVLIAVWLVRSLPLDVVRWGVIVVVLYTAVTLIRLAVDERRTLAAVRAGCARSSLTH